LRGLDWPWRPDLARFRNNGHWLKQNQIKDAAQYAALGPPGQGRTRRQHGACHWGMIEPPWAAGRLPAAIRPVTISLNRTRVSPGRAVPWAGQRSLQSTRDGPRGSVRSRPSAADSV
jgi:hypothetical protein